jgi:hypothetical protein
MLLTERVGGSPSAPVPQVQLDLILLPHGLREIAAARPPDLPPRLLMTMDFAINCSLVRPSRPPYPVLVHPRLCSTLPSDPASRQRPCASLILRRHQAG